jgi:hypothetical protein
MSKSTLEEIIRVLPQAPEKEKFLYYPKGLVQKQNDKLVLNLKTEDNRPQTLTLNATPPHAALQQAHWSVELFIKDFVLVTDELNNFFMNYKNTFYFLCFALVFAIMSCQVFLRITRWPLFNLLLLIILSRGFLTFYNLMRFEIIIKLLKLGSDSFFIRLLPSLCLVGLGILFFIIDILFIPANLRQKEIENA